MAATVPNPAKRVSHLAAMTACLLLVTGCQSFTVSSVAHVRVIALSPDTGSIDIYQGGSALAYNLSYGTVTSYIPAAPGTSILTVDLAGSKLALSVAKATFMPGGHYTVLVNNSLASLQQVLLTDSSLEPSPSGPSVRLIHQAAHVGAVDVYLVPAGHRLASVSPIFINLAPGATTGYLQVPAGVCTAVLLPTGTVPSSSTIAAHTSTQLSYEAGALRSLILIDSPADQPRGLQVIATADAEPRN